MDFFWDSLTLGAIVNAVFSWKEGGQGLVHLASRVQFVQRFLTGPPVLVWRGVASCLLRCVNNLALDAALFLILKQSGFKLTGVV